MSPGSNEYNADETRAYPTGFIAWPDRSIWTGMLTEPNGQEAALSSPGGSITSFITNLQPSSTPWSLDYDRLRLFHNVLRDKRLSQANGCPTNSGFHPPLTHWQPLWGVLTKTWWNVRLAAETSTTSEETQTGGISVTDTPSALRGSTPTVNVTAPVRT